MTEPQYAADPSQPFSSFSDFYQNSAYAEFPQEHLAGGSFGISMIKVEQTPIDFIDAALPELAFCRSDTPVREVLIDSGDGPNVTEKAPTGFVVYPAYTASRSFVSDPHQITQLAIPVHHFTAEMKAAGIDGDGTSFAPWLGRFSQVPVTASRLMDRMWQTLQAGTHVDHLLLDGLTLQFLAELTKAAELAPLGESWTEDARIARVLDYIEAHYGKDLKIAELAAVACLSSGHFSRTFKATIGEPVWTYVTRRRCERANEMLRATRLPIAEIAYRCGFANQAHLTSQFGRHFGLTPGSLRQEAKP